MVKNLPAMQLIVFSKNSPTFNLYRSLSYCPIFKNAHCCRRPDFKFPIHFFFLFKLNIKFFFFKSGFNPYQRINYPISESFLQLWISKHRPFLHEIRSLDHWHLATEATGTNYFISETNIMSFKNRRWRFSGNFFSSNFLKGLLEIPSKYHKWTLN